LKTDESVYQSLEPPHEYSCWRLFAFLKSAPDETNQIVFLTLVSPLARSVDVCHDYKQQVEIR